MEISYRKAFPKDLDLCREIHHSGMRPYVEALWGWKNSYQDERFKRLFKPKNIQILIVDSKEIGYLETETTGRSLKIENLMIETSYRKQGIGQCVLKNLMESSRGNIDTVVLNVIRNNPSQNLYSRMGFVKIHEADDILTFELRL